MKHYAMCSFGKDSIATILLALMHNEPIDAAIYTEVMFDNARGISGEIPEHIEWIDKVAIPRLAELGCPTIKLRGETDAVSQFFHVRTRGKYAGKINSFPIGRRCDILNQCKLRPVSRFLKEEKEYVKYIGIAVDEPKRLERLDSKSVSLLAKYGYTEKMAYDLCKEYGLLSPIYATSTRGGCWFCPNQSIAQFSALRNSHPELWAELRKLDSTPPEIRVSTRFSYDRSLTDIELRIDTYERKQKQQMTIDFENDQQAIQDSGQTARGRRLPQMD